MDAFSRLASRLGLSGWMVNPLLFLAGALLVSVPIIIHLLNKRRFKTVDWAAMDFLIEADKKNHRRIRIENLLMLLLRCLAVLLIALLIARPFRPHGLFGDRGDVVNYNRIVILDDSLSMAARNDGRTAFDRAKEQLRDFVNKLARNDSNDYLTVILASQPHKRIPALSNVLITQEEDAGTKETVLREVESLELTDRPAQMDAALAEARKVTEGDSTAKGSGGKGHAIDSVIYVLGDLRVRDWGTSEARDGKSMIDTLREIGRKTNCYLVNVGGTATANLTVTQILPRSKMLIAGVEAEFDVFVRNHGASEVRNVPVRFSRSAAKGKALGEEKSIPRIAAGATQSVRFRYTFASQNAPKEGVQIAESVRLQAEVLTKRNGRTIDDTLSTDNVRYFAARIHRGIPVLLVDGDPTDDPNKSETFYLRWALAPEAGLLGDAKSGFAVRVVQPAELPQVQLDDFRLIFLCNVFRLDAQSGAPDAGKPRKSTPLRETVVSRLEMWVRNGGRLVMSLGDQIDRDVFNREFHRFGRGLSPLKLHARMGDEKEASWATLRIEETSHALMSQFHSEGNSLLGGVKIFRWWSAIRESTAINVAAVGGAAAVTTDNIVAVPLKLTATEPFPALAEKIYGKGRTVLITTAVDADWTNWTHDDPTFPIFMLELGKYLSPATASSATVTVGQPVEHEFHVNQFDLNATMEWQLPNGTNEKETTKVALNSLPVTGADGKQRTDWNRFHFEKTDRRGFYRLPLKPIADQNDESRPAKTVDVLFAANIDATEGDLQALEAGQFEREIASERVRVVGAAQFLTLAESGAQGELWLWVLVALVIVLFLEQFLGWYFGMKR